MLGGGGREIKLFNFPLDSFPPPPYPCLTGLSAADFPQSDGSNKAASALSQNTKFSLTRKDPCYAS